MYKKIHFLLISLLALMSSCATNDEISMTSVKIESQTEVSMYAAELKFLFPPYLEPEYIELYKDGEAVDGDNKYEIRDNACNLKNLKPNTTYTYDIVVSEDRNTSYYDYVINNEKGRRYGWGHIAISDPSFSFKTLSEQEFYDTYKKASLSTGFNSDTYFIGYVNLAPLMTMEIGCQFSISKNSDGSNPTTFATTQEYSGVSCFYASGLEPETQYYVFIKGNFALPGHFLTDFALDVMSFTTAKEGDTGIPLVMTSSVKPYDYGGFSDYYNLCFDFDNHLIMENASISVEGIQSDLNVCEFGSTKFRFKDLQQGVIYTINKFSATVYFETDEGYRCRFPVPLWYEETFSLSEEADNRTRTDIDTLTNSSTLSHNSDKDIVRCGFGTNP